MVEQYIFGYGSLLDTKDRNRSISDITGKHDNRVVLPAVIHGFERGWWNRGIPIGYSTTVCGIRKNENAHCNGVIFSVTDEELARFDQREGSYNRTEISASQLVWVTGEEAEHLLKPSTIWTYLPKVERNHLPDEQYPIIQSYVDMCINGCLELEDAFPEAKEKAFARLFIQTTQDWNEHWVNDRIQPRRPHVFVPRARQIDALLAAEPNTEVIFPNIKIE